MTEEFDPRTTLARPDLAEQALEGIVRAQRYAEPSRRQCAVSAAAIRKAPDNTSEQQDQLVFGEAFDVLDEKDGWAWGRARRDGYVGWVEAAALAEPVLAPTHRVSALRTYAFAEADHKSAVAVLLTLNSLVTVEAREGRFVKIARAGWVVEDHLAAFDTFERDAAGVAERYLGAPYQWGGRESLGLDCSGLVQQALYACGRACPRDADMQAREAGETIEAGDGFANLRRGDLVFWEDHVALMVDEARIIHATSWHMQVAVEPLAAAVARVGAPTTFRRL
ncbi:NlpC/P60 family protein [Caulobacter sp. 17J65-9]|uniref:NlpC/P60 family protein n=1 Tax=Caulobacter sp. 17J65-9 TaxID=2709382 RepID=UPI0013C861DF|nr:C40 family peptidase [Caulobacter sp. 17J65-9]